MSMNLQKKHLESIDKICPKDLYYHCLWHDRSKTFEEDTIKKTTAVSKPWFAVGIGAALFFVLDVLLQIPSRYRTQISVFSMQYLHFWLLCMDRLQRTDRVYRPRTDRSFLGGSPCGAGNHISICRRVIGLFAKKLDVQRVNSEKAKLLYL